MMHAVHRAETSPKRLGTDKQSFGDKAIFDLCAEYTMRRSMILSPYYFKLSGSHQVDPFISNHEFLCSQQILSFVDSESLVAIN